jgi:hypothetical protein
MTIAGTSGPPPSPRPFRSRAIDAMTAFLLLFGAIWAVVDLAVVIGLSAATGPAWNDLILDRRGVAAEASVTSVAPTSARVNGRSVYRVGYTFTDAAGLARTTSSLTTASALIGAARGTPVAIAYDPQSPSRARLDGERASLVGLFILIPVGLALVGGIIFLLGLRRVAFIRAIYVHGQAVPAVVTAISRTPMRVNGRRVMRVDYSFETITGRVAGRTSTRDPPPVGGSLWVIYEASDPKRSVAA